MAKVKQTQAVRDDERAKRLQFGQRVKQAREKLGLSQHDLAVKLSVTAGAVAQWELGNNGPQMKTYNLLVQTLGVSAKWLSDTKDGQRRDIATNLAELTTLELFRKIRPENQPLAIALLEQIEQNQGLMPMMQPAQETEQAINPSPIVRKRKATLCKMGDDQLRRQRVKKYERHIIA